MSHEILKEQVLFIHESLIHEQVDNLNVFLEKDFSILDKNSILTLSVIVNALNDTVKTLGKFNKATLSLAKKTEDF